MNSMDKIRDRLKKTRLAMNLSQSEFAKLGGVQISAQANYERGSRFPTMEYIYNLKKNDINITYIFFEEGIEGNALSVEELRLISAYRNGSEMDRQVMRHVAKMDIK